jgi:hypothetical protein
LLASFGPLLLLLVFKNKITDMRALFPEYFGNSGTAADAVSKSQFQQCQKCYAHCIHSEWDNFAGHNSDTKNICTDFVSDSVWEVSDTSSYV